MQAAATIKERRKGRAAGAIVGGVIAAALVVGFVVANLGLGSEGAGRRQLLQPPAAPIGVVAR